MQQRNPGEEDPPESQDLSQQNNLLDEDRENDRPADPANLLHRRRLFLRGLAGFSFLTLGVDRVYAALTQNPITPPPPSADEDGFICGSLAYPGGGVSKDYPCGTAQAALPHYDVSCGYRSSGPAWGWSDVACNQENVDGTRKADGDCGTLWTAVGGSHQDEACPAPSAAANRGSDLDCNRTIQLGFAHVDNDCAQTGDDLDCWWIVDSSETPFSPASKCGVKDQNDNTCTGGGDTDGDTKPDTTCVHRDADGDGENDT